MKLIIIVINNIHIYFADVRGFAHSFFGFAKHLPRLLILFTQQRALLHVQAAPSVREGPVWSL